MRAPAAKARELQTSPFNCCRWSTSATRFTWSFNSHQLDAIVRLYDCQQHYRRILHQYARLNLTWEENERERKKNARAYKLNWIPYNLPTSIHIKLVQATDQLIDWEVNSSLDSTLGKLIKKSLLLICRSADYCTPNAVCDSLLHWMGKLKKITKSYNSIIQMLCALWWDSRASVKCAVDDHKFFCVFCSFSNLCFLPWWKTIWCSRRALVRSHRVGKIRLFSS